MKKSDVFLNIVTLLFIGLRLINYFFVATGLQVASAVLLILIAVGSLPGMKRQTMIIMGSLLIVGVVLLSVSGAGPSTWLVAILKNANLVVLLALVPMISAPFYYEDYQGELKHLAKARMRSVLSFLMLVSLFEHVLGVIISIGAVMIVYELMEPFSKLYKAEEPFLKTISRSYNSSGFWSPAWASVVVFSLYPDVKWVKVIPVGILFALLFNGINIAGVAMEKRRFPDRYPDIAPEPGESVNGKRLLGMLLLIVSMIAAIVLLNTLAGWDLMLAVSVVSILFPMASALLTRKLPAYREQMRKYYRVSMLKGRETLALFMLSGFLGKALDVAGVGKWLAALLPEWLVAFPPLLIAAIIVLMILPSFIGVHPAATGTALLAALSPEALGLSHYTFALTILTGWLMTIMLAPFSATGLLLAGYTGRNSYSTSVGMNWRFGIVCLVVFSLLIGWVGPWMG